MDLDRLESIIVRQGLHLQAAQGELAELRKMQQKTWEGIGLLSTTKAEDLATLRRIEAKLDGMESDQGDMKALIQEINRKLSEEGL